MKYRSTKQQCPEVTLREAMLQGLAADGGLYVPETIPRLPADFGARRVSQSVADLAPEILSPFVEGEIAPDAFSKLLREALNFPAPLVTLSPQLHVLELFHGPTLAFKDFGARTLARLMSHFARAAAGPLTVLVATSGDTGSAVAHGFLGVPGIRVVILYPAGRVSEAQEKQFTTLGENILAVEVAGAFDDCQRLAKQAFADAELNRRVRLTSANSINIGRLLPQMLYYFAGVGQLADRGTPVVVSVPSGNFGNLTAGLMAKRMGLAITQFVAATNINDVVPEYLRSGSFLPRASQRTLSNAMDVGNPSNFARMTDLCANDLQAMRHDIWGCGFTDDETLQAMKSVHERFGYVADPHTAVGILGFETFMKQHNALCQGIVLATAHPAKFAGVVERATGVAPQLPARLAAYLSRKKNPRPMSSNFAEFKEFLIG